MSWCKIPHRLACINWNRRKRIQSDGCPIRPPSFMTRRRRLMHPPCRLYQSPVVTLVVLLDTSKAARTCAVASLRRPRQPSHAPIFSNTLSSIDDQGFRPECPYLVS
ncbi:hypothetical protein PoMZ_10820 [Pyricularia oryzae]|uniref:Uncharacterized protein n=1 Tax=Pyricularia oryzae TaxID=318829 RepID=A0A4P7N553_PYROR|nr:hypothetical protein PoMZ_10820 [Pyricularia oryzae]